VDSGTATGAGVGRGLGAETGGGMDASSGVDVAVGDGVSSQPALVSISSCPKSTRVSFSREIRAGPLTSNKSHKME
jgi:hypothetical protein